MTRSGGSDVMSTIKSVSFQEHGVDPVNSQKKFHVPRIILHDKLGNKLDTHTALQEAIYRDKWNVKQTQEARKPNEWRLPKAPPPAKPDLSRRVVPDSRHRSFYCKDDLDISSRYKKETKPKDMPHVEKRHYFKIAFGSFTERYSSETIKKDSSYVFPGFWAGCTPSGKKSYERNALPPTHRGSQTRSGGGFAYWKHDRAESEISGNESWGLYTTSSSGEPMSRTRSTATDVSSVEIYLVDGKKRLVFGHDDGIPLDDQTIEELCTMEIWDNIIDSDCDHVLYQDKSGIEILIHNNNLQQIQDVMPPNHPDREKVQDLLDTAPHSSNRLSVPFDRASRLGTMSSSLLSGMSDEKGHLMEFIDSLERSSNFDSEDERPLSSRNSSRYKDSSSVDIYLVDGKKRLVLGHDDGVPLDDQTIEELCTMEIWDNIIDSDCDHVLYQDKSGIEILIHKNNLQQIQAVMPPNHPDREKVLDLLDAAPPSPNRLSVPLDIASRLGTMSSSSLSGMAHEKGHLMDFIEKRSSSLNSNDEELSVSRKGSQYKDGSSVEIYLVDGKKRLVLGHDDGVPLDDQTIKELCTMKIWDNIIDSDCDHVLYQDKSGIEILIHKNNLQQIEDVMPPNHPDREKVLDLLDTGSDSSNRLSVPLDISSRLGTMSSSSLSGMAKAKDHLMDFIAPKAFKLKDRERKQLTAQSPFSTNRQYDIPKGPGFKIQKSTKELTQFINVDKGDGSWKEPTKFELQKYEREMADFIRKKKNEDGKRYRSGRDDDGRDGYDRVLNRLDEPLSPDSGLDSEFMADAFKGKRVDRDKDDITNMKSLDDSVKRRIVYSDGDDITKMISSDDLDRGEIDDSDRIKADREKTDGGLNREIQERPRKGRKKRQDQNSETTGLSTSSKEKEMDKQKDSDTGIKDAMRLASPHVTMTTPDLPQIEQRQQEESKKNMEYAIEAPPVMKQTPKIRKSPPKIRTLPDMKRFRRRRRPSEARVTAEGLKEIQDPLDFLAKYCIINPVRLPFYELIFEAAVMENKSQFPVPYLPQVIDDEPPVKHATHQQQSSLSQHEKTMIKDMTLVSHGLRPPLVGYSVSEQCLEKINFTMETLHGKKEELEKKLKELEAKRMNLLVKLAKAEFPGIDCVNYSQKKKKGKKKKPKPTSSTQKGKITDETIIERLDKKNLAKLCSKTDIRLVDIEIDRIRQKIEDVTLRQNQLKDEKNMLLGYCEDDFVNRQFTERHSNDLRRKQSDLYNTLRPTPDYEITLDNLRGSLQKVNNHLLTDRECEFLYQVLDLPGRERINFRLFSVVAALSEKVTQLDPMVRRLMNKHDYKALDIKMEKCRELFSFLEDDIAPPGEATATSLSLELAAGGLKQEHINYVLGKFNREGQGLIDFMDFVTYVPLFVEIHQRIIKDPLSQDRNL